LQLQTLLADLQGELAVGHLQRQAQALGPLLGLRFKRRARASTWMRQAAGCSIMKTRSKKLRIGKKWPINQSTRILPELSVDRKMSGILPTSIGYISPKGDFSRHNTQALAASVTCGRISLPRPWPNRRVMWCQPAARFHRLT
jgi:hypothetical protein